MAHGKETPRQKMIGMMYLVLTAMLALNVSKEVLEAFVIVNGGLVETTENFASKNEDLYSKIDFEFAQNPEKAGDWKALADEVKQMSDELYDFMNECKVQIVQVRDPEAIHDGEVILEEVKKQDNLDTPGQVMLVEGKGVELKERINAYTDRMVAMISNPEEYSGLIESIKGTLSTEDHPAEKIGDPNVPWEIHNFDMMPLAAVMTILSKLQGDVRNIESDMASYMLEQVGAKDFKVNVLEAVVLPNSNVVFKGQEYRAAVFLAAYDSTKVPEVVLEGGQTLEVEGGKGIYTATSNTAGERKWGGILKLDNDGQIIEREFEAN